jgi:hypothetical protein
MPRGRFFRILAMGSIDILITLPIGIYAVEYIISSAVKGHKLGFPLIYPGWKHVHTNWDPVPIPYVELDLPSLVDLNFESWSSVLLALTMFALFGLTKSAREIYWRGFCAVFGVFGWHPRSPWDSESNLASLAFASNQRTHDSEQGCVSL